MEYLQSEGEIPNQRMRERAHDWVPLEGYGFSEMMQCTCLYMHNTCPSTEDSYTITATNYGFVLSLKVCKMQCNRINCHHQLLLNSAVELDTRSSHLEQGTPEIEADARLLPKAKATYLKNTPFHRLYLKVIAITFSTSHKTSLFSSTYFPRIQLTIKKINNQD
jgi:hypothetical protein